LLTAIVIESGAFAWLVPLRSQIFTHATTLARTQILWVLGVVLALSITASGTYAQETGWTPFYLINGNFYGPSFEPVSAEQAGYGEYATSWPVIGTASPGTAAVPPAWVGALVSAPSDLGTLQIVASDGAGNFYGLYSVTGTGGTGNYSNYISKTTPNNVTVYFGIPQAADRISEMAVTQAGTVYFQLSGFAEVYVLNPDGSTAGVVQPAGMGPIPPGFSIDGSGDIIFSNVSFFNGANWGAGPPTLTEIFAATGPVPYYPEGITMPGEDGYGPANPQGIPPTVPFPPPDPTYTVPLSPNPTIELSIGEATSTLPVTYQWYYDGAAIGNATLTTYDGPFLGNGTYSVTASTSVGTVTANATLELAVTGTPVTALPVFLSSPQDMTVALGTPATLGARAVSTLPITFQWFFNGTAIPGANGSALSPTTEGLYDTSYVTDQPGVYTVVATTTGNGGGSLSSSAATLTVTTDGGVAVQQVPSITAEPQSTSFSYGSLPDLSVSALASLAMSYQWQLDGVAIPGATQSSYSTGVPGTYTVSVTTTAGSVTSSPAVVALASRPINLSARAMVGADANACIAGFVVSSYSGSVKQLLVRAIGPTLSEFNVSGFLANPVLTIIDRSGKVVASNTGWGNSPSIEAASTAVGAFALPTGSADSALLVNLPPGAYTAQVTGEYGTTGVALVEVYEVTSDSGHLINMSTRAPVGTGGSILIGGFVIGGSEPSQLLIRAVGPSLAPFGVSGTLSQPVLSVYDSGGNLIAVNVGWSNGSSDAAVAVANAGAASGAFPLTPGSADSAVLVTLSPGQYTAQVSGVDGSAGIALVEVYQVP